MLMSASKTVIINEECKFARIAAEEGGLTIINSQFIDIRNSLIGIAIYFSSSVHSVEITDVLCSCCKSESQAVIAGEPHNQDTSAFFRGLCIEKTTSSNTRDLYCQVGQSITIDQTVIVNSNTQNGHCVHLTAIPFHTNGLNITNHQTSELGIGVFSSNDGQIKHCCFGKIESQKEMLYFGNWRGKLNFEFICFIKNTADIGFYVYPQQKSELINAIFCDVRLGKMFVNGSITVTNCESNIVYPGFPMMYNSGFSPHVPRRNHLCINTCMLKGHKLNTHVIVFALTLILSINVEKN